MGGDGGPTAHGSEGEGEGEENKGGGVEDRPPFPSTSYTCKETTHEVAVVIVVFAVNQWSPCN